MAERVDEEGLTYRVVLPRACFGVVVHRGVVVEAAPIARRFVGQPVANLARWIRSKGGYADALSRPRE